MALSRRALLKGAGVAAGAAVLSYAGGRAWIRARKPRPGPEANRMQSRDKIILLGIDGLDPGILGMLRAEGAVPHFDRLCGQGSWAPLQTVPPSQSPVVWTTLATGTNPGKHGVFDFIHRDPDRPLPFLSVCQSRRGGLLKSTEYVKARRNAAFWDVLTEQGIPVTAIRWPVTFPAETISGRMLSGLGVPGIRGTLGHYTLYTSDPAAVPDVPPDRLVHLEIHDGRAETAVEGPLVRGLTRTSSSTVSMTVQLTGSSVRVQVADGSFELAPGEWSDWVPLEFSLGALKSVTGMVKFHLGALEPGLKLYMTPLEQDPRDPAFPIGSPGGYAGELASSIGLYHTLGMPEDTKALNEGAMSAETFADQCNEITQERFAMFWHEFKRFDGGVFAFVFDTSDRIQHMFWRGNQVDGDLRVMKLDPRIREHYLLMDRFVGELLDAMDSETGLLVVSDHGFTSYETDFDLNAWLVAEGFMTLTDSLSDKDEEETALYRLVDWSKTVAYGCGFSSLYLNLKGRESKGIVGAGEAGELARKIADRAADYRDPTTGGHPVVRLSHRDSIYSGPELANAPDMVLGTSPGYRMSWTTAVGGVCADVLKPNEKHWSGDHIVDHASVPGTVLTNMPLDLTGASVLDIAPTVLALLNLEPLADCDGRALPARDA